MGVMASGLLEVFEIPLFDGNMEDEYVADSSGGEARLQDGARSQSERDMVT